MFDGAAFAKELADQVRGFLERALSPVLARLEAVEARAPVPGPSGEPGLAGRDGLDGTSGRDGIDGKDGDPGSPGRDGTDGKDGADGAPGAPGRDGLDGTAGRDGIDGKDGEPGSPGRDGIDGKDAPALTREQLVEAILAMPDVIDAAVARRLAANPPPKGEPGSPGRDGIDGLSGQDGLPGRDAVDGKDGRDGVDGRAGIDGLAGKDGRDGLDGKDGVGLAGTVIDRDGQLIVTLSNGECRPLGPVVGKAGDPGLGFDDFDVEARDDGRTLVLKFERGDVTQSFEVGLPIPIYRDVWREGEAYDRGDLVTWAGSLWHCDAPTTDRPGEGSPGWTLAVKRGRDGRDLKAS